MTKTLSRLSAAALMAWAAAGAAAQETTPSESQAWQVYEPPEEPRECLATAEPIEQLNTRDGQPVEVSRGETRLFVFYRPAASDSEEGVMGQVAFTGGYPFAADTPVTLEVGGTVFQLPVIDGQWAWPANPDEDARIVAALKSGTEAVVSGQSARGTVTRDTFSLLGVTAAIEEAARRCAS